MLSFYRKTICWVCACARGHTYSHTPHTCHRQLICSWFPKGRTRIGRLILRRWHGRWASPEALKWMRSVLLLAQVHPAQAAVISQACWFISSPPRTAAIWWLECIPVWHVFSRCWISEVCHLPKQTQKESTPRAWLKTWLTRQNSSLVTLSYTIHSI